MKRKLPALLAALALMTIMVACSSSKGLESPLGKSHVMLASGVTVVDNVMEAAKTTKIEDLGFREVPEAEFLDL